MALEEKGADLIGIETKRKWWALPKVTAMALIASGIVAIVLISLQFRSVKRIQARGGWVETETGHLTKMLPNSWVPWLEKQLGSNWLLPFETIHSASLSNTSANDSDLIFLKRLTRLKRLNLIDTKVTDTGLIHLKGLTDLEELQLDGTQVTDSGLIHLKGLTSLERLYLPDQVTDAGLIHLKELAKLSELQLYDTKVTDGGLIHLEGLTNLKTLFLGKTTVTEAGVKRLQAALPKCHIEY